MDAETLIWLAAPRFATGIGGLCLLAVPRPGDRLLDLLIGATGGLAVGLVVMMLLDNALG
jgi:hypothetical protein